MLDLNHKSIIVTGGTGSFGKMFIQTVLTRFPKVKKLIVYSRDELKQFEMQQQFSPAEYPAMRYFIGNVRDGERLRRASENIDIIVHAAAMKQVPAAEYNPFECIKTNVLGAQNIVDAAMTNNVNCVVALSTDKAAAPVNLYGATKLCSDKLFVAANNAKGDRDLRFSVVRYGNVIGSRGSVIPFFMKKRKEGELPITHAEMTRFNISLEAAVEMVLFAIENSIGGEIFIPKLPSYRIQDVATAVCPYCTQKIVGIRPGEKLHEEMITPSDSFYTLELKDYFVICPNNLAYTGINLNHFVQHYNGKKVPLGFSYNSGDNTDWLTVDDLRGLIVKHVDADFKVRKLVMSLN
ncbi:MAG: UDP-N-acetylglucosamine 4,6-dehydratase [Saprospiraceae bacterium]|jgi:UDP-N-acetylglucosamine 4,6-dehydratase (inverting)